MRRVLVVDAGGRGNAIAHALARSEKVDEVCVVPGNAGSEFFPKMRREKVGSIRDIEAILEFALRYEPDFTVVGPEEPLSLGIVDLFRKEGLPIIGPTSRAAILESSKCWTKDYLSSIGVPVPPYRIFDDKEKAKDYVKQFYEENPGKNLVIKADGIAAGKGTFVCNSMEEALTAVEIVMGEEFNRTFRDAGRRIEIEERLYGNELSLFAITDGETVKFFGTAKDYKRRYERDDDPMIRMFFKGINPNTGGMGSYSPHELEDDLKDAIMEHIVMPTIENFRWRDEYVGILHFVLMKEEHEELPRVLEINVRDGDPEAQSRYPRLRTDTYDLFKSIVEGRLEEIEIEFSSEHCVGVCAVSGRLWRTEGRVRRIICPGYPGDHRTNQPIYVITKDNPEEYRFPKRIHEGAVRATRENIHRYLEEDVFVYANGIEADDQGYLATSGGRVLTLVAKGRTREEAREKAYRNLMRIWFNGMEFRKDIGL